MMEQKVELVEVCTTNHRTCSYIWCTMTNNLDKNPRFVCLEGKEMHVRAKDVVLKVTYRVKPLARIILCKC